MYVPHLFLSVFLFLSSSNHLCKISLLGKDNQNIIGKDGRNITGDLPFYILLETKGMCSLPNYFTELNKDITMCS